MGYDLYMNGVLYPIAPSKVQIKQGNNNKTINLINEGEVNILKTPGLKEISFDLLLPNIQYPFASYPNGFQKAEYYVNLLQALKGNGTKFQFILSRMQGGSHLFSTNLTVTMEDVSFTDDAKEGFDIKASVKLKEWRNYGTKTLKIVSQSGNKEVAGVVTGERTASANAPQTGQNYTVQKGDSLWKIAKHFYGNGAEYTKIASANPSISNPDKIYPGQTLKIP